MIDKIKIEELNFTHLGAFWWKNEDDSIRLRQWKGNEIDIWRWSVREDDQEIVFRGKLNDIDEIQWVLNKI